MVTAVLVTLLAGAATIVGGLLAVDRRLQSGPGLAAALAFAGGAMVAVSAAEIVPKGVRGLAPSLGTPAALATTLLLVLVGALVVVVVQRLLPQAADAEGAGCGHATHVASAADGPLAVAQRARLRRSGLVVALVVAGHNLPEGLVTFVSTLDDPTTGIAIAVAIAIHNVPEGVAVAAPVVGATGSRSKAVLYAAGSGLAEPVGGLLGYLVLAAVLPEAAFGAVFGLIAGMMAQISVAELLPTAARIGPRRAVVAGASAGAAVMVLSLVLLRVA